MMKQAPSLMAELWLDFEDDGSSLSACFLALSITVCSSELALIINKIRENTHNLI